MSAPNNDSYMPPAAIPDYTIRHATLRQLQVFESIYRHGSFTRAAEELFLTQPTVSMQIKKLTDVMGLPLFEHVGRNVERVARVFDPVRVAAPRGGRALECSGIDHELVDRIGRPRRERIDRGDPFFAVGRVLVVEDRGSLALLARARDGEEYARSDDRCLHHAPAFSSENPYASWRRSRAVRRFSR